MKKAIVAAGSGELRTALIRPTGVYGGDGRTDISMRPYFRSSMMTNIIWLLRTQILVPPIGEAPDFFPPKFGGIGTRQTRHDLPITRTTQEVSECAQFRRSGAPISEHRSTLGAFRDLPCCNWYRQIMPR